ncbi:ExeA family protein [Hippea maritima]|uniref:AAA ATPase n=1 Tax=Hippea maritima (strain ATCC 700847 / DSM 10411 / MH2) TaxID=760142 RepID=F2LWJ4_HIPMA|nr:AAA family ATPase [Hippea maritima]AEA34103.1 AAA ATPase [Hippea maritima DSM 10411]
MYKEFFGFDDDPFRLTPDPGFFYSSEEHDDAIKTIEYAIKARKGLFVLVGEVGVGKTTLSRVLLNKLINVEVSLLLNPFLSADETLNYIATDFGLKIEGKDRGKIFQELVDFFVGLYKSNKNALIIVDESQHMSFESMEMLRQISNIEMENAKLVQILLVGQSELINKLNQDKYRQIKQRVAYWVYLKGLSLEETKAYIEFRTNQALKYRKTIFKDKAIKYIYKLTKGNPREINQLAETCLILAAANKKKKISPKEVVLAAKEYYKFDKKRLLKLGLVWLFR